MTAVLTLTDCNNNDEYKRTVREMFDRVAAEGLRNVAVDLRDNRGGSSLVANESFPYLNIDSYREWKEEDRFGM